MSSQPLKQGRVKKPGVMKPGRIAQLAPVVGLAVIFWAAGAPAQNLIDEMAPQPARPQNDIGARTEIPIQELLPAWSGKTGPAVGAGQTSPGIKIWNYDPLRTELITIQLNSLTSIIFPEWERIEYFKLGDGRYFQAAFPEGDAQGRPMYRNAVEVAPRGNVVEAGTSLIMYGAMNGSRRNVYTAWITSVPKSSSTTPDLTVFVQLDRPPSFTIPAGEGGPGPDKTSGRNPASNQAAKAAATPAAGQSAGIASGPRDPKRPDANADSPQNDFLREIKFDYAAMKFGTYEIRIKDKESATIAPVRVMEDGYWTFIDFGENGRSDRMLHPAAWRVIDGVDNQVNTRAVGPRGNILVVEGTGYNITLRNGERVVCLVYTGKDMLPGSSRSIAESQ